MLFELLLLLLFVVVAVREAEIETHRETETETDRARDSDRDNEKRHTNRQTERERDRDRETERQREKQTDRQTDSDRDRDLRDGTATKRALSYLILLSRFVIRDSIFLLTLFAQAALPSSNSFNFYHRDLFNSSRLLALGKVNGSGKQRQRCGSTVQRGLACPWPCVMHA